MTLVNKIVCFKCIFIIDTITDVPHFPLLCSPPPSLRALPPPTASLHPTAVCVHGQGTCLWCVICVLHCVPTPQSQLICCHHVWSLSASLAPIPLPSGHHRAVVCVCEFFIVFLFVHLLLSVLYPTHGWNPTILNIFWWFRIAWHSLVHPCCPKIYEPWKVRFLGMLVA